MRRDDTAQDAWVAFRNRDDAHDPEATGMLSAIVAPLAAAELPVGTAASYDGDLSSSRPTGWKKRSTRCGAPGTMCEDALMNT